MPRHFKVHELLTSAELADLEAFAGEPGRTVAELEEWLLAHGFRVSRGAVWGWKRHFDERAMVERMNGSGALAKEFMAGVREGGGLAIPDAAVAQMAQMIFESAARMSAGGEIEADDLTKMSLALQRLTLAKSRIESTRAEFEQRQRAAIEQAEKTAAGGGTGASVVATIKQALGITEPAA
jgi:hypothetical protein